MFRKMEVNLSIMTKDQLKKFIVELDKENKNLKEINESQNEEIQRFKDNAMADMTEITKLEVENKKLRKELRSYEENKARNIVVELTKENKQLQEEIDKRWRKYNSLKTEKRKLEEELEENDKQTVAIEILSKENLELKKIWDNREEKIADLEIEICKLKEELSILKEKYGDIDL